MKDKIIEIVELGQTKSLIQRENAPITELIKTDVLIEELNERLLLLDVVGRSEQLLCTSCDGTGGRVIYDTYLKCKECNGSGAK